MNWDKKVISFQHERGINATQLGPAEAIAANRQARIIARWQREQLLSQESVSKAAASLCRHDYPMEEDFQYHWENFNSLYIEKATTALAATLLGED